jgi:hypothetical protein
MAVFSSGTMIQGLDGKPISVLEGVRNGWYELLPDGNVKIPDGDPAKILLPLPDGQSAWLSTDIAAAGIQPIDDKKAGEPEKPKARDFANEARLLYPSIPEALREVFVAAWERYGNVELALAEMRRDARYDQFFAGNRRPDGTVVLPEAEYLSTVEGYDRRLRMFDLDPSDFRGRFGELIQGGKSPDEFEADLAEVQTEVILQGPAVRAQYAAYGYSADISDRSIMASRLAPGTSPQVFEQRFRAAQVGAEAVNKGFTYGRSQAERLAQAGVDQEQARQLFGQAASELPTLNELMNRHNDPDDDLTLDEYTDAVVLRDPEHLQAIARVLTRERSQFSGGDLLAKNNDGGVLGLRQR